MIVEKKFDLDPWRLPDRAADTEYGAFDISRDQDGIVIRFVCVDLSSLNELDVS
jgi:hypothetical protein